MVARQEDASSSLFPGLRIDLDRLFQSIVWELHRSVSNLDLLTDHSPLADNLHFQQTAIVYYS
jgi:hypothetical protein